MRGFTDKIYNMEYEHPSACSDIAKHSSVALVLYLGSPIFVINVFSDVPGLAWAQSPGLGWALAGSGLPKPKPDPQLSAGPGLGLVGLKPGLMSQRSNRRKYYIKIC